jgi:hypothetical protein
VRRAPLVRLGWPHWSLLVAGLLTLLAVVWIMEMPSWEDWYVRVVAMRRLEAKYGFRIGAVAISPEDGTGWAIVSVTPGGAFERMGLVPGDLPVAYHGRGWADVASALAEAERGRAAAFDVVNAREWRSWGPAHTGIRTISIPAPPSDRMRPIR